MKLFATTVMIPFLLAPLPACQGPERDDSSANTSDASHFKEAFSVSKPALRDTGKAAYMSLQPGHTLTFQDDEGGRLSIRVLAETRQVDGVTTRVIEEYEEADGRLVEISRNFFAIEPATGDVYYFGEEVDIYKNGAIDNHAGAWLSGANGAHFGLGLPGRPSVGERYYQEIAPGVAMDRGEIISLDEQVATPAGTFEHCLHVKETTPLEKSIGHKWYAPNVGLIKDDDMVLVSVER